MTQSQKYLDRLDNPPEGLKSVARLLSWAENEQYPSTATLFAFITGIAQEHWGMDEYPGAMQRGFIEASYLADALQEFSNNPDRVESWFIETLAMEEEEDDVPLEP